MLGGSWHNDRQSFPFIRNVTHLAVVTTESRIRWGTTQQISFPRTCSGSTFWAFQVKRSAGALIGQKANWICDRTSQPVSPGLISKADELIGAPSR